MAFAKLFYSLSIYKIENSQSILEHVIVESSILCAENKYSYIPFDLIDFIPMSIRLQVTSS